MVSTHSEVPKPDFIEGEKVAGWKVVRPLGLGGFGVVVEVEKDGIRGACKAEFTSDKHPQLLKKEVPILLCMQWSKHFCRLYLAGQTINEKGEKINVVIMTLVGHHLNRYRRQLPAQRFSLSTSILLAKQCLAAIRDLHFTGFLHRDIKGCNFAWHDELRTVYLLDMGFVRQYLVWTDEAPTRVTHRPLRKEGHFLGTTRYISPHVHLEKEQGRRDDLWGLLYMIIEFIRGRLPWHGYKDGKAGKMKLKIGSRLVRGCPIELHKFHNHIRCLGVGDRPDYEMLMDILESICARFGFLEEDPMDFEPRGKFYEYMRLHKGDPTISIQNTIPEDSDYESEEEE